jgi:argininosuccinate lyase
VRVDEERVRHDIESAGITLTELAESLVREEGMPVAEAHAVCSRLAEHVIATRTSLAVVEFQVFRRLFADAIGRAPALAESDFRRFTTPEHFVAVRTRPGGPAPAPMATSLATYRAGVAQLRTDLAMYDDRFAQSTRALDAAIAGFR